MQELGEVYAPDLPGFGEEPRAARAQRTAAGYADWVAERLRHRWGGRPVVVAGYSLGGTLALLLALRHPSLVARAAVCCSPPRWLRGWRRVLGAALLPGVAQVGAEVFEATVRLGVRWSSRDPALAGTARDMVLRADRGTMVDLCRDVAGLDLWGRLGELTLPVLVVAGSRDFWLTPSEARAFTRTLPDGRLHVCRGAGHLVCLSRAEEFSDVLARFFRR